MDGVTLFLVLLMAGSFALISRATGSSRRDAQLRRQYDARIESQLYRTTHTDATGMLVCRRCGADAHERAGSCPRCGAPL